MVKRTDWMPYGLPEKLTVFENVRAKIDGYAPILPLTADQLTRIKEICDTFIYAFSIVEQSRSTMKALVSWRDMIMSNEMSSSSLPERPLFNNALPPAGATAGIYAEFRKLIEIVKASPGFTSAIGEDLKIMPPTRTTKALDEIVPSVKVSNAGGHSVRIAGSLDGMDAMRVEYLRKGAENWRQVAFLTSLPEIVPIEPAIPGEPEAGGIRCILLKKNKEVGMYSAVMRVTISED
jgi:hypothetical protein